MSLLALALLMIPAQEVVITTQSFPNDLTGEMGCVRFESGLILKGDKGFGGHSAMRLDAETLYLLSDDGIGHIAQIVRREDGFISSIKSATRHVLTDAEGVRLNSKTKDTEGLVLDGDQALISVEGRHRVARFSLSDTSSWTEGESLYRLEWGHIGWNKGFESLARLKDGRLLTISEDTPHEGQAKAIFLTETADGWEAAEGRYRPAPDFAVTDTDIDPETGDLFVVERAFSPLRGPRARLYRIAATDLHADQVLEGKELVRLNALDGIDNMEGLEIERRDGRLIAHLISDDNFNSFQKTVLMGFTISEAPECLATAKTSSAADSR